VTVANVINTRSLTRMFVLSQC